MKNIIVVSQNNNIESNLVKYTDIVLAYKNGAPVGYVHYHFGTGLYKLYANYFSDNLLSDTPDETTYDFVKLDTLIEYYDELTFKLVEL
jgi:hypothetical protein